MRPCDIVPHRVRGSFVLLQGGGGSSFDAVLTIVIIAFLLGWAIRSVKKPHPRVLLMADRWVLWFALPVLVISKISRISVDAELLTPALVAWASMTVCVLLVLGASRLFSWNRETTGALLLIGVLGNTSFLGLGMVEGLLGAEHLPGAIAYDQLGTFLALATFGSFISGHFGSGESGWKPIVRRISRFGPFIGLVISVPVRFMHLPDGVYDVMDAIGKTVPPVAMGALGLRFSIRAKRSVILPTVVGLGIKMMLVPGIVMLVATATGSLHEMEWATSILESAAPPMVTAGVVAVGAGLNEDLVAFMVGMGTLCAFASLPLIAAVL